MELKAKEFEEFRTLVYRKSGISLGAGKESLVSSRISKRMRSLGIDKFRSYLDWINEPDGESEMVHMLDAISTNTTSFFRESEHFDFFADTVSRWCAAGQRRFRFWSAACSSGEEPYTVAMTLLECGLPSDCDIRVLATDMSTRILASAREGIYPQSKIDTLPAGFASKYFKSIRESGGTQYQADDRLKGLIAFKGINLSQPPFPMQGPMDIIFVRNVMIYFDNEVRKRLIDDCFRLLKPGGYLLVGHAESLNGLAPAYKCLKPSIYMKPNA